MSLTSEELSSKKNIYQSLEVTLFRKYVFNNASKHWNHYVRKLLHNSLEICLPESSQCHPWIEVPLNSLNYLVQYLNQTILKLKKVKNLQFNAMSTTASYVPDVGNIVLIKPLQTSHFKGGKESQYYNLYFNLHPKLHLNITFHYIFFSSNSFLKCSFGSLSIKPFANINNRPISYGFKYCGVIPSFTIYPPSNRIIVDIVIGSYDVTFDFIMSHSVIDFEKLISYPRKNNYSEIPITVIKFSTSGSYLLRYELQGEMYEIIHILCNVSQHSFMEVYDGPGTLYNLLEPFILSFEMVLYKTTTFQSIILLQTKNSISYYAVTIMYIKSFSINQHKEIYVQNNSVQLTSEELTDNTIQILKIEVKVGLFVNITILQINYTGNNHSSCGLAGVTSYDIIKNGTFKKISTVCHSSNSLEYKYRNIYSQNSVMLLVLYSFKRYSNFTFKLLVSTSKCKATTINICDLKHDPLNLESKKLFFIKRQSCIVLQLDYGQGNISSFNLNKNHLLALILQSHLMYDGGHFLRGQLSCFPWFVFELLKF